MSSRATQPARPQAPLPLRIGAALLAGAAIVGIAAGVVERAMVNAWIEAGAPPAAAASVPPSAAAGYVLAQTRAAAKDWQGATEYASAALARAPIDIRLARTLGLVAEARKAPEAAQWLALGGQLGWRDTPMQLWQVGKAAEYGDISNLVVRGDSLLRRNEAKETVLPLMRNAAGVPGGAQLIAERLAAEPNWRPLYFMDYADFAPEQMAGQEAVLAALKKTGAPPKRIEIASYLRTLVGQKNPARAHRLWSRLVGGSRGGSNAVFDSGFTAAREHPPEEVIPFEWNLQNGAGAGATTEVTEGNAVLVAQTDGSALTPVAAQLLLLAPGTYRFSALLLSPATAADQIGFAWGFTCVPNGQPLYPDLAPGMGGGGDARSLSFTFVVPSDCPAQQLELRSTRLSPPVSTEARFDNIQVTRAG